MGAGAVSGLDRVQPPFMLYTLHAEPDVRNSPPLPAVTLMECELPELGGGRVIRSHQLTPDQARDLARMLTLSATEAERRHAARSAANAAAVIRDNERRRAGA